MGRHIDIKVGESYRFRCEECDITMNFPSKSGMLRYLKLHKKFCNFNQITDISVNEITTNCKTQMDNIIIKNIPTK